MTSSSAVVGLINPLLIRLLLFLVCPPRPSLSVFRRLVTFRTTVSSSPSVLSSLLQLTDPRRWRGGPPLPRWALLGPPGPPRNLRPPSLITDYYTETTHCTYSIGGFFLLLCVIQKTQTICLIQRERERQREKNVNRRKGPFERFHAALSLHSSDQPTLGWMQTQGDQGCRVWRRLAGASGGEEGAPRLECDLLGRG